MYERLDPSIQYKRPVTVVYIDFCKAFDVVSRDKLVVWLAAYGDTLLKLLQNFLSNRTHCIRVGTSLSTSAELISGVIQGSGIGPLLFLTYINELAKILEEYGITIKFFCRWSQDVCRDYWYWWRCTDTSRPGQHGHWQMLCSTYWTILDCFFISTFLVTSYTVCGHQLPVVTHCRDLWVIIANMQLSTTSSH